MNGIVLDENIPKTVQLSSDLPLVHATDLGTSLSDSQLWSLARASSWVVVTKDADFSNRIMTAAPPPWSVHLRFGNMRRLDFEALLVSMWPQIHSFLPQHKLVIAFKDHIEAVGTW